MGFIGCVTISGCAVSTLVGAIDVFFSWRLVDFYFYLAGQTTQDILETARSSWLVVSCVIFHGGMRRNIQYARAVLDHSSCGVVLLHTGPGSTYTTLLHITAETTFLGSHDHQHDHQHHHQHDHQHDRRNTATNTITNMIINTIINTITNTNNTAFADFTVPASRVQVTSRLRCGGPPRCSRFHPPQRVR